MKTMLTIKKLAMLLLALALLVTAGAMNGAKALEYGEVIVTTGTDIPDEPILPPQRDPKPILEISGQGAVRGGSEVKLQALLDGDPIASSLVEWAVYPYNDKLCTISQGVLSTKKVEYPQSVQVTAVLKADTTVHASFVVTIRPAVAKLTIYADSRYVDLTGSGQLRLRAELEPELTVPAIKWVSSSPTVASVSQNGLVTGHKTGLVVITATAQDGSGASDSITLQVVKGVTGLDILGPATMTEGATIALSAVALPGNASVKDVTWEVDCDEKTAIITSDGKLTAKTVSEVTYVQVTAASTQNPDVVAYHTVTIRPAVDEVQVFAEDDLTIIDLVVDPTLQLWADTYPEDSSLRVSWSSSDTSVATVDVDGLVTGKREGKVTITARATDGSGVKGTIDLEVLHGVQEIVITGKTEMAAGQSITLTAAVAPDYATHAEVIWAVDAHSSIATITKDGKLTVKKDITEVYTLLVTATSKENPEIVGTHEVVARPITKKVEIYAPETLIDIADGRRILELGAVCTPADASQKVTWKSSNTSVAQVSQDGLVTGLMPGVAQITATATDGSGLSASVTITVAKAVRNVTLEGPDTVAAGQSIVFKATVAPEDASNQQVIWSVDCDSDVATIKDGKLTAGRSVTDRELVTVTAASKENPDCKATLQVLVTPVVRKVTIAAPSNYLDVTAADPTMDLTAVCEPDLANQKVTWESSDEKVATVDARGLVTAVSEGKVTITATAADGSKKSASVTLNVVTGVRGVYIEGETSVAVGQSITLKAIVRPEDASNQKVKWSLNCADSIATISAAGKLTAKYKVTEPLVVVVTAVSAENEEIYGTHVVIMRPAVSRITIEANQSFIDLSKPGRTLQLSAICDPDGAKQDVVWSSSKPSVASIDENGLVTAKKAGSTSITAKATDGSGKMTRMTLNVVRGVQGVVIEGVTELASGEETRLKAYVMPEDASNQEVVWSIDCAKDIATIDQDGRLKTAKALTERVTVTVTAASKESASLYAEHEVAICPVVDKVILENEETVIDFGIERTLQLMVSCEPADASQLVTWSSSKPSIATVDENGLVTAKKVGTTSITAKATDGSGKMVRVNVEVRYSVHDLEITGSHSVAFGKRIKLNVNFLPENVTNDKVIWSIDCEKPVATIDENGRLQAKSSVTEITDVTVTAVSAENPDIRAHFNVTLRPAVTKVDITTPKKVVNLADEKPTVQLVATCLPDSAGHEVKWSSNRESVATVDENGLVTGLKNGTVVITAEATDGSGVKDTITLEVVTFLVKEE